MKKPINLFYRKHSNKSVIISFTINTVLLISKLIIRLTIITIKNLKKSKTNQLIALINKPKRVKFNFYLIFDLFSKI